MQPGRGVVDDSLVGVMVGSYRITKLIGQGGMGRVYLAVQPEVGTRVAIKVLNEEYAREPEQAERFFAEARAVNLIAHDNIVNVIDLVRLADGRPVIVMELLEGQTLREIIHGGGRAPIGAVVHVMIEVLSAVAAAHSVGIVHRDLKPDNILVLPSGRAKVLDFGIAKLVTAKEGQSAPRTRTGALIGTPEYMAPEQISGRAVDARTDIYATGIVLYEAMTGRRPFEGDSDFEVMRAHVDEPPPSARSKRTDIPADVDAIILRALAKSPSDRFSTATDMANALQAASAALPPDEWRAFSANSRAYARPAPLTPSSAKPLHASRADGSDVVATLDATPRARDAGSRPRADGSDADAIAPTMVDPSVAPHAGRRRTLAIEIGAALVCIAAIIGVVLWRKSSSTTSPKPAPTGTDPRVRTLEVPPTYDKARFDPVAFYPHALELARRLVPDAELMFMKVVPAHADGTIDLTAAKPKQNVYLYRARTAAGSNGERACVGVEPYPEKVIAFSYPSTECEYPLATHAPHCTVAKVWALAHSQRPITSEIAHVGFFGDEAGPYWYVDPSMATRTGAGIRVDDDWCEQ